MGFVNVHTRTHARSARHLSLFVLFILSRCVVVLLILRNPVFVIKFKGTVVLFPLVLPPFHENGDVLRDL